MRTISLKRLREFWAEHPEAQRWLREWYRIVVGADWSNPAETRQTFPHADPVKVASGTTMTVFNVGGNKYRVVVRIIYEFRRAYIRRVMTHAEYSKDRWKADL